jgi:hypothetical protein
MTHDCWDIAPGLEDHDGVTQTSDVCLEIMQRVNSA